MRPNAHKTAPAGATDSPAPDARWREQSGFGGDYEADGFDRVQGVNHEALYEAMARPDRVDYVEHGLRWLGDEDLPQEARSRVVHELLLRMITDLSIPRASFEAYLVKIQTACPAGFSASAAGIFRRGHLPVALVLGNEVFLRLARMIELHLQSELGLQRSEHLLMLNEAVAAWAQARILHHEAMALREDDDIPFNLVRVEARYRSHAEVQQKVFLRLWRELKRAAQRVT